MTNPSKDPYDALFTLYQKGSLYIETILDILEIDHDAYNETFGAVYGRVGEGQVRKGDAEVAKRIAETLGVGHEEPVCSRCGGTGNIGEISSYRCPDCGG